MEQSFKGRVITVGEHHVTVQFDDGQELRLPKSAVDGSLEESREIRLIAVAPGGDQAGRSALAKELLKELI